MNRKVGSPVSLINIFLVIGMCAATAAFAETGATMRTWTSASGATVDAAFMGIERGLVQLRKQDGSLLGISPGELSRADQVWLKKQAAAEERESAVRAPAKPGHLPVFAGGEWLGRHIGYQGEAYDAEMRHSGDLYIYPKDEGERIGEPIRIELNCIHYRDGRAPISRRRITAFTEPPEPVRQPEELVLTGILEEDVPFTMIFSFGAQSLSVRGYCEDPPGVDDPTVFRIIADIPELDINSPDLPQSEWMKKLAGWKVVVDPVNGKKQEYPYTSDLKSNTVDARSVLLDAPVYGTRRLTFQTGDEEEAPIKAWNYEGLSPASGFLVIMTKENQQSRRENEKLELVFE